MEQTAVEYAIQGIEKLLGIKIARDEYCIQEANIIFEQQIIDAHLTAQMEDLQFWDEAKQEALEYYNETFKSE